MYVFVAFEEASRFMKRPNGIEAEVEALVFVGGNFKLLIYGWSTYPPLR